MSTQSQFTLVMVDDNADEIFITRKLVRREGIINSFISERRPEELMDTLGRLGAIGVEPKQIIVLLDVNMPRVNGFEVLTQLRRDARYQDMMVIMLSSSDDEADIAEATRLGANGYLVKPFSAEELFATLAGAPHIKFQLHAA
jgi:two-component system response regulator